MRLSLITLKRRPDSDEISRRETLLTAEEFRVGRGSDMDINLPDVAIAYHHATLSAGAEGLVLTGVGGALIEAGGDLVESVALRPGAVCRIGAFEIGCEAAPEHADHAITLTRREEAPRGAAAPQRIVETLPSRRRLSWILALAVLLVFVAWPLSFILQRTAPDPAATVVTAMVPPAPEPGQIETLVAFGTSLAEGTPRPEAPRFTPMESAWLSGPLSNVHANLGEDCGACHLRPFEMTTNAACLACHADTASHFDVASHADAAGDPALARCAACHKEHQGGEHPVERASSVCTDCHADLKAVAASTTLFNVSDFADEHPQFRPTLVTGVASTEDGALKPTVARAPLDPRYPLTEESGLKFPHDVHLNKDGVRGLGRVSDKIWDLTCQSCHLPQADGALMRPVEMERDCGYCHELVFQPENFSVLRELPHAKAAEVQEIVHDYYAARALEGGVTAPGAPASVRRRPGTPLGLAGREEGLAWASAQAELELKRIMEVSLCGDCHVAEAAAEPDDRGRTVWKVQGALLQRHWMPKSSFNHKPHFAMDCVSCHAATTSKASTDVLMPPIEDCRACHKGENAGASASSECLACHEFHIDDYAPMSPPHGAAMAAQRERAEKSTVERATR
ncbi:cytochrome c3 family protein [Pikeienuella sp. HZG-20]|uniref:cytochrome c3 family protein n=1 Tax=Paludibacillus litoralis TaxID=3133267 RepID=UPI0030EB1960